MRYCEWDEDQVKKNGEIQIYFGEIFKEKMISGQKSFEEREEVKGAREQNENEKV